MQRPNLAWNRQISIYGLILFILSTTVTATEPSQPATKTKPITLGFFPIITTVALFKRFAPLRDYLAEQLGRPVELQTARDFPTFLQRTDDRQYDIVVTAPHYAVRAADSGKYVIRVSLSSSVEQLLVVRDDSPVKEVSQLAGKRIATPPANALMTMVGVDSLHKAGLVGDREPKFIPFPSHNAANAALFANEVDAAIASSNVIMKAMKSGKPYRIIDRSFKMPNMATLVASDLDSALGEQVVKILTSMKDNDKGKEVLKQIAFPGYRVVNASDYEPVRPYMEQGVAELGKRGTQDAR